MERYSAMRMMKSGAIVFHAILLAIKLSTVISSQAAGQETLIGIVGRDFILLGADSSVSQGLALTASNLDKIASLVEPFKYDDDRSASPTQQQTIVVAAAGDAALSDRLIRILQAEATMGEYEAGVGCDVRFVDFNGKGTTATTVEPGRTVEAMAYSARSKISSVRPQLNVCLLVAGMMLSPPDHNIGVEPSFLSQQLQRQVKQAWNKKGYNNADEVREPCDSSQGPVELQLRPHLYWLDEFGSLQKIQYGAHGFGSNFCLSVLDQGFSPDMNLEEATQLLRDCFQQLRTRYIINSPQPPCIKCVDAKGVRLIR